MVASELIMALSCVILTLSGCVREVNSNEILDETRNQTKVLSRRKRYVTFPEGASFSAAFCLTTAALAPSGIFTEGLNWGIAYDLPNDTSGTTFPLYKGPRPVLMRRRRSELYQKFEVLIESVGLNGQDCLQRTLCEAMQQYSPRNSLFDEIIRIIFHFPMESPLENEPPIYHRYKSAHQHAIEKKNCKDLYNCPLSMLDL